MPKVTLINFMSTRSNIGYIQEKYKGEVFEKSFFPNTLKLWNNLPKDIQRNYWILRPKSNNRSNHQGTNIFQKAKNLEIAF